MEENEKVRAGRNRTIVLTEEDKIRLSPRIAKAGADYLDKTINSDLLQALPLLPDEFADLIIIDPPYNLTKNFAGKVFNELQFWNSIFINFSLLVFQ